jgi:hypothetical protein
MVPCHQTLLHELIVTTYHITADSLENYYREPDCFRKAAGLIRAHCGQLDMGEGARINGDEHTSHGLSSLHRMLLNFCISGHIHDPLRASNCHTPFYPPRMCSICC